MTDDWHGLVGPLQWLRSTLFLGSSLAIAFAQSWFLAPTSIFATECWGQIPPLLPIYFFCSQKQNQQIKWNIAGLFIKSITDGHAYYCTSSLCQAHLTFFGCRCLSSSISCTRLFSGYPNESGIRGHCDYAGILWSGNRTPKRTSWQGGRWGIFSKLQPLSIKSALRCWSTYVLGVSFGIKVTFRFAADADCAVVATCLKHVLGSIGFWQEESWQQKMNMEMQDGTNMDKHPKFRFAILYLSFCWKLR